MDSTRISSFKVSRLALALGVIPLFFSGVVQASVTVRMDDPFVAEPPPPMAGTAQLQVENGIFDLGSLGNIITAVSDISADGRVVVGIGYPSLSAGPHAFLWTRNGGMTDLGTLGAESSYAAAVSANGNAIVGYFGPAPVYSNIGILGRAFRWTQATGMVDLGTPIGANSIASSVSADGSVVAGTWTISSLYVNESLAFRWTQSSGITELGTLGGTSSTAARVSGNGAVVVGSSDTASMDSHAFRWSQNAGMTDLGTLGGTYSSAFGVSFDGNVVVGNAALSNGEYHAYRWTPSGGMADLGSLGGGYSQVAGISNDGGVVVGSSATASYYPHAFRWTQTSGMVDLGTIGGHLSVAMDVSADGKVVVGLSSMANEASYRAFRWSQSAGMQSVEDWLRSQGVSVASDTTYTAVATNRDGSVVVGQLQNGAAYIARVASAGSGLVTLADVQESLNGAGRGSAVSTSFASTAINGAHSNPLSRRVASGQRNFWIAGDWGRDDHGDRAGEFGLAELGLGYNFGFAQLNVSLGQTWAQQRLTLDGRAKVEGTYLLAEALIPVSGSLWATLGGYGSWGNADLRRAYLNGGLADFSMARPATQTSGVRARLDWENAVRAGGVEFSPYVDLTYSETKLDAYTETGGGFPARFDARKDKATELRLGTNASYPMMGNLRLLGTLEAAHRFEKSGARSTGEVVGVFGFDLDGIHNNQDWVRVGAGVEGQLAGGRATLSVNATTQGSSPSVWMAANWQLAF